MAIEAKLDLIILITTGVCGVYIHIGCFIVVMTISIPLNFGHYVFKKQWYYDENKNKAEDIFVAL